MSLCPEEREIRQKKKMERAGKGESVREEDKKESANEAETDKVMRVPSSGMQTRNLLLSVREALFGTAGSAGMR